MLQFSGMSDLLAPVLVVMENEVDAFWCFAGYMDLIGRNFEMDQSTMKKQMSQVRRKRERERVRERGKK